jgi:mannose PTS system EIIA component
MIGILVVTHGNLGRAFVESSELIIGKQTGINALGLFQGDSIEEFKNTVKENILQLDEGEGVLVLVDIFGGSPSNVTLFNKREIGDKVDFRCITGVNMPIFLEACMMRNLLEFDDLVEHCFSLGTDGIRKINLEDF